MLLGVIVRIAGSSHAAQDSGKDASFCARLMARLGKTLTYLLRHGANQRGLHIDRLGGIRSWNILAQPEFRRARYTKDQLMDLVRRDDKNRFTSYQDAEGHLRVRAYQGHHQSVGARIDDCQALRKIESADELDRKGFACIHGTYIEYWRDIEKDGLKNFDRKHIHFGTAWSECKQTTSGIRKDSEILIFLNVSKFLTDAGELYLSGNNVLLTAGFHGVVSPKYFQKVEQIRPTKRTLWPIPVPSKTMPRPVPSKPMPSVIRQPATSEVSSSWLQELRAEISDGKHGGKPPQGAGIIALKEPPRGPLSKAALPMRCPPKPPAGAPPASLLRQANERNMPGSSSVEPSPKKRMCLPPGAGALPAGTKPPSKSASRLRRPTELAEAARPAKLPRHADEKNMPRPRITRTPPPPPKPPATAPPADLVKRAQEANFRGNRCHSCGTNYYNNIITFGKLKDADRKASHGLTFCNTYLTV